MFLCVALQLNTDMHIILTPSFGAQIQPEHGPLHNMHLGQFGAKAETVKVAASQSLKYKYHHHFNT